MSDLHITCENLEQRQDVFDSLDKMGLVPVGSHSDFLQVNAAINKRIYMTVVDGDVWPGSEILTYPQFMDKYSMNQLKTKIDEVKAKIGLTQMQLSERIGKNPYYLDTVKHRGVTTERQLELIRELDLVANGGTVMTERELIASLSEQLVEAQDKLQKAQAANKELCIKLKVAEHEHRQLEKMYDSNWDELQALKEENSAIKAVNGVLTKEQSNLNQEVVSLLQYKQQYRDLLATVLVVGIIVVLGLSIWSAM